MRNKSFNKILIANRGEISLRIIRAIHTLGKSAVVVHSKIDSSLPFVREADESFSLGSGNLGETYLDQSKILSIARKAGADAIHPGYGFLAENAAFAQLCENQNITFIGPDPETIRTMGDKPEAKEMARKSGLPILESFYGETDELLALAGSFPYPVLIKPSSGGGGKGMRIVHKAEQFEEAAIAAAREAKNYFGSDGLYVEKYLENVRHIEVQVMADHHGNSVHLFERECSIQRRYQKIIEEAPSVSISPQGRKMITESAIDLVKGMGYTNAGTVEFLMDNSASFYFMEMNTRIQVEHPVTEMITGIDLVKEQITIAEGYPLSFRQEDIQINGHAIEARIYAEDPDQRFQPSTGTIGAFRNPNNTATRVDTGYGEGDQLGSFYDPLIAKVISHGPSRSATCSTLLDSLKDLHISGLTTNRDYLVALLQTPSFANNLVHTMFVEQEFDSNQDAGRVNSQSSPPHLLLSVAAIIALQPCRGGKLPNASPWNSIGHWRLVPEIILIYKGGEFRLKYERVRGLRIIKFRSGNSEYEASIEERKGDNYRIRVNGQLLRIWAVTDLSLIHLDIDGHMHSFRRGDFPDERYMEQTRGDSSKKSDQIVAPLNGRVIKINGREGNKVDKGESLLIIESMKMENNILAPRRSILKKSHVSVGDQVHNNQILFTLDTYE